jgi:hypothetical protein
MDDNQVVINAAEIEAWHLRDVTARNYIFATLTKAMKQNLYSCETAAAMWTRLDTQYQLRAAENLHLLWQSFYDFTHHVGTLTQCKMIIPRLYLTSSLSLDDDMTSHIQKLTSVSNKLRELGQPLDEMQLVTKALATLPEKFRVVRSVWASVPLNERTIDNLLQRLRSEENVLKSYEREDAAKDAAYAATLEPLSICLTKKICYKISHLSQLAHGSFPELVILNWK